MRLGIIADIHGNCVALEAVLAELDTESLDGVVCLGDTFQGGPQPREVVHALRDRRIPTVMGNTDAWLLTGLESVVGSNPDERMARLVEVHEWSMAQLDEAAMSSVRAYQPTITLELGGGKRLLCYHGSPNSFDDILLPETPHDQFENQLGGHKAFFFCGGHTHVQFLHHIGQGFHFNPGSVGETYRHHQTGDHRLDSFAEFAILTVDRDRLSLEFRRAAFDVPQMLEIARERGRPHADMLAQSYGL